MYTKKFLKSHANMQVTMNIYYSFFTHSFLAQILAPTLPVFIPTLSLFQLFLFLSLKLCFQSSKNKLQFPSHNVNYWQCHLSFVLFDFGYLLLLAFATFGPQGGSPILFLQHMHGIHILYIILFLFQVHKIGHLGFYYFTLRVLAVNILVLLFHIQ